MVKPVWSPTAWVQIPVLPQPCCAGFELLTPSLEALVFLSVKDGQMVELPQITHNTTGIVVVLFAT